MQGCGAGRIHAPLCLLRLPLCADRGRGVWRIYSNCRVFGYAPDRGLSLLQSAYQQAGGKRPVEPEGQLSGCAGGLSHPRAECLDGRRSNLCKNRRLLHGCGAVFHQVAGRSENRAVCQRQGRHHISLHFLCPQPRGTETGTGKAPGYGVGRSRWGR